jgi:tRNA dimethylallyltransferase
VGPTAIGKTTLAIRIAQELGAEILSSDSRQFYHEIPIGTAQPSAAERATVPHHFIDFLSIQDEYSSGTFETEATQWLSDHFKAREEAGETPVAVMAGGSGLYVQAVHAGFDDIPSDPEVREALNAQVAAEGLAPLLEELQSLDPHHFAEVDQANTHRVIRALEVCRCSGQAYSTLRQNFADQLTVHPGGWARHNRRGWDTLTIGIGAPRDWLHKRINDRVHVMLEDGWIEEAKRVLSHRDLNALKTVGYPQLFDFLEGKTDMETATRKIQEATRQFARRQLTWFHRQNDVHWVDARCPENGTALALKLIRDGHL